MIRVSIFNEFHHERHKENVAAIYPNGIHATIADFLSKEEDITVRTFTQNEEGDCPELTEEVLNETDVLLWWGHVRHEKIPDELAVRVQNAVLRGMGFIPLHSAHHSKPFKLLMGTPCNLSWRNDNDLERIWIVDPAHPIAQGIDTYFELNGEEAYTEPFAIPEPDHLVFIGWYEGGEVFRSGCCFLRGNGRIFYFQPGHESFPTFHNPAVQTVIKNAVRWTAPIRRDPELLCPHVQKPTVGVPGSHRRP